jgi:hypothetical protein
MSDHWYDETATDLRFGYVVDEEPEPVTVPLSQAVLDHLHRELAARNLSATLGRAEAAPSAGGPDPSRLTPADVSTPSKNVSQTPAPASGS